MNIRDDFSILVLEQQDKFFQVRIKGENRFIPKLAFFEFVGKTRIVNVDVECPEFIHRMN